MIENGAGAEEREYCLGAASDRSRERIKATMVRESVVEYDSGASA